MKCPKCGDSKSHVVETQKYDTVIARVRRCDSCGHPWQTNEENTGESSDK